MSDKENAKLGIQSVEIAAEILSAISDGGGLLHLKEISAATRMHRGKVHRYITSLTRSGLLSQDPDTGAYGIGPLAVKLGLVGLRRLNPVQLASRGLGKISGIINETVILLIWGSMGPTVVAIEESNQPIILHVRVGSVLSLKRSATGQVFEAFLPAELIKQAMERELSQAAHIPEKAETPVDFEDIRTRRMARSLGTLLPGINALAAPIFDHNENLVLVVGIVGRQETLDVSWDSQAVLQLRYFVEGISSELGSV